MLLIETQWPYDDKLNTAQSFCHKQIFRLKFKRKYKQNILNLHKFFIIC